MCMYVCIYVYMYVYVCIIGYAALLRDRQTNRQIVIDITQNKIH
jgi:hypothetical protein